MITVNYNELNLSTKAFSDLIFLKRGNLWLFLSKKQSYYFGGFYFKNNKAFKFFHSLNLPIINEINIISPTDVFIEAENNQFFVSLKENNEIEIKSLYSYPWKITFDSNFLFNLNPFLRNIKIEKISSCFLKIDLLFNNENILSLFIETACPLKINSNWIKQDLDLEKERDSSLKEWWVFDGIETNTSFLKIKILEPESSFSLNLFSYPQSQLLSFILRRIEFLLLENYLPAGFPWFFENWYRDELLSLFLLKEFLKDSDFLLSKYLFDLESKWNLSKKDGIESADIFLLFLINLNREKFFSYFNVLKKYFNEWRKKYLNENNLSLPPKSTWMDTLQRESAVEILSLYLKALELFNLKEKIYKQEIEKVKALLKKEILKFDDPNLPFVFVFVPEIYSLKEWQNIFDQFLKFYFLDWGGMSSKRKDKNNFYEIHSGENSLSYHSGDSWYFLNNLLAFCLRKINPEKYEREINLIIKSSLTDLLKDGALGYSSEISSAKNRKSEGSLVQIWSMASLVKLLSSFQDPDIFLEFLSD